MEKIRCSKCGSTLVYIRIKTNEMVCRKCTFVGEKSKEEEETDANPS